MLAAVGNRVETLHRSRFGPWVLPAELAPGQWRWVNVAELAAPLRAGATAAEPACAPDASSASRG
jgi:16S rRNA pseudouridine516 synthase